MPQQELLRRVVQVLDEHRIQYMITGSIASSLHGEPRSTQNIDIVVAIDRSAAKELRQAFPPSEFYLDEGAILHAIKARSMFNLIDVKEGDKVDFWILTDVAFDRSRFLRRCAEEVIDLEVKVSSPEDTILAKLRWAKLSGGSKKQFTDALRVFEVQFEKLDMNYLERWVKELEISDLWERLKAEAETV